MHDATFVVGTGERRWIVRIAPLPANRLRKSAAAQRKAASVGVRVPEMVAVHLDGADDEYAWVLEQYVTTDLSRLDELDLNERLRTCADVGRQLRLLHSLEVSGFGWLDQTASRGPRADFGVWLDCMRECISEAMSLGTMPADLAAPAARAFDMLGRFDPGPARLCHGDVHAENILVAPGRMLALIDWGNAKGCEGCHDLGVWLLWQDDFMMLEAAVAGYDPDNVQGLRERVIAHCVALACGELCDFSEDAETVAHLQCVLRHGVERLGL
jgi:aminoglycoside phosphotransferase (APT) family kinase protein